MTTTTLLAACNEVLLNVGEIEVSALTSPVAKKAKSAFRSALTFTSNIHHWDHLRSTVSPLSWSGSSATFTPFQEVYGVQYGTFILYPASAQGVRNWGVTANFTGDPRYYAQYGNNVLRFYPTPTVAIQALITADVLLSPTIPVADADAIVLPDEFFELVQVRAQHLMHRNHTTDAQAAQQTLADFELMAHMLRSRQAGQPVSNFGMNTL